MTMNLNGYNIFFKNRFFCKIKIFKIIGLKKIYFNSTLFYIKSILMVINFRSYNFFLSNSIMKGRALLTRKRAGFEKIICEREFE